MPKFHKDEGMSRQKQILCLTKYIAALRYRALDLVQNQGSTYKGGHIQSGETWNKGRMKMEKHEYLNSKKNLMSQAFEGMDTYMFKYGIPEMLFENQEVIDRIINGVK